MSGTSFILNIALASSLSLLWGLINSLQLVTHFLLTNVRFPINAATWYGILYELATFDLISTEALEEKITKSVDEDEGDGDLSQEMRLSSSMIEAGYDDADSLNGSMISFVLIGINLLCALLAILIMLVCKRVERVRRFAAAIYKGLFWNFYIVTLLEMSLGSSITSTIRLYVLNKNSWW